MSRNGNGTYNLPAGNPVVTGTTISSTWANNTLQDMANAITGSIAADGQTTITGPLKGPNGTVSFGGVGQIKIPSGATSQRASTPTNGMIRYNTDLRQYEGYSDGAWSILGNGAGGTLFEDTIVATQGQTVFTSTTGYVIGGNNLAVYVNGSRQIIDVNYTETSTTTFTFFTGLNAGDLVNFSIGASVALTINADAVLYNEGSTGAIDRTVQSKLQEMVSVKDFGAKGDNTADDTAAIQAAIDNSIGQSIFFPAGTYLVTNLTISDEVNFIGEGYSLSQISQIPGTTGAVVTIDAVRHPSMRHLSIAGTSTGGDCVLITGASSGNEFFDCFFTLAGRDGIHVSGTTDNVVILDCILEVNGRHGIFFDLNTTSGSVVNSRIVSNVANGIVASGNTTGPGHRFSENAVGGNVIGIQLLNQYFTNITNNSLLINTSDGIQLAGASYCNVTSNISNNNTNNGITLKNDVVISTYNNISNNGCTLNANGIYLTSASYNNVTGNVIVNNLAVGVALNSSGYNTVANNQILGNGLTTTPKYGVYLTDGGTGASSVNRILGNNITNLGNSALQTTGVYNGSAASNTIINNNNIVATTPINFAGGSVQSAGYNQGFITESSGSSFIASGATSVTLNHGLSVTPTQQAFSIMPTGLSSNDPGEIYIDTITSTQFTVHCRNNPGVSTLPFYWKASVY